MNFYSNLEHNRHFHTADIARQPLPCYFDITNFRGGQGKVRTEVNFEIPARELTFEKVREGFKTDFEVKVAVYDLNMEEVVSGMDVVDIDLPEKPEPDSPWLLPAQFILTLDPGYYRFGLEVRDRRIEEARRISHEQEYNGDGRFLQRERHTARQLYRPMRADGQVSSRGRCV